MPEHEEEEADEEELEHDAPVQDELEEREDDFEEEREEILEQFPPKQTEEEDRDDAEEEDADEGLLGHNVPVHDDTEDEREVLLADDPLEGWQILNAHPCTKSSVVHDPSGWHVGC